MAGAFEVLSSVLARRAEGRRGLPDRRGLGWHEHSTCLFRGTERFFRPGYTANLVRRGCRRSTAWSTKLSGARRRRRRLRPRRLDHPDGEGVPELARSSASTTTRRRSRGRASAAAARASPNRASRWPTPRASRARYDLVAFFDCLHDMGDPVGAARARARGAEARRHWLIVEPFANDQLRDNLNPVGRIYYAASTMVCTPASLSQEVGLGLGAQAGEARLREVRRGRRLHPLPPRHRDAIQPRLRGAALDRAAPRLVPTRLSTAYPRRRRSGCSLSRWRIQAAVDPKQIGTVGAAQLAILYARTVSLRHARSHGSGLDCSMRSPATAALANRGPGAA